MKRDHERVRARGVTDFTGRTRHTRNFTIGRMFENGWGPDFRYDHHVDRQVGGQMRTRASDGGR